MDFLPTFANFARADTPTDRNLDGHDIGNLLLVEDDAKSAYDAFYYYRRNHLNAVRRGPWKLHFDEDHLYNLDDDIGETQDHFDDQPKIVKELTDLADSCRDDLGDERSGVKGKNCRPVGRIDNPRPLTDMDWTHPYMVAAYD